jgi:hypothetical protein
MKTKLTLLTCLIIAAIGAKAQNLITVQHAGTPKFYTKLPDAITGALAGDTILIPGGGFDGITINKRLYLIGVGTNPDSTSVTARTSITLTTGADNGVITGISSQQNIYTNADITGYTISRCNVAGIAQQAGTLNGFTISENIMNDLSINGGNHRVYNNIFTYVVSINNSIIRNNLFLFGNVTFNTTALNADNCIIENNILEYDAYNGYSNFTGDNNLLNNNTNVGANGLTGNNNQGNNNFITTTPLTIKAIFPTYDANTINGDGIYKANFNLPAGSPYKNAGRDGTDIGIYGGVFPWKPGSVPSNPHFQSLKVAPQTDSSGNLKVQITVAAQSN